MEQIAEEKLVELNNQLSAHTKQAFEGQENALVFGEGPLFPRLMLIGEAPGEQESILKRPFVGKAGKNLDDFLLLAGLRREEIYISNVVKYRPTKQGKSGRLSNRPPSRAEVDFFSPYLLKEISLVSPAIVATLGNVPLKALTDSKATIGDFHGRILPDNRACRPLFALYHPASLIYNRSLKPVYEQDVLALAKIIREGLPDL